MQLKDLLGLKLVSVKGGNVNDEEIEFTFDDGTVVKMHHSQDCCEHVCINDIDGDIQDLVGGIVTQFDESSNHDDEPKPDEYAESWTWTFYNIATTKGFVNIRWLGESNGYYSESVDIAVKTNNQDDWDYGLGYGWKSIN